MRDTNLSAGPDRCTGREAQRADEGRRKSGATSIRRRIGGQLTIPSPGRMLKILAAGGSGQVEIPENAYFFRCLAVLVSRVHVSS